MPDRFATSVFNAVKLHDANAPHATKAFSELFELPQVKLLRNHFKQTTHAEVERPYELQPTTGADLYVEQQPGMRINAEYKAIYKTWFLKNHRAGISGHFNVAVWVFKRQFGGLRFTAVGYIYWATYNAYRTDYSRFKFAQGQFSSRH